MRALIAALCAVLGFAVGLGVEIIVTLATGTTPGVFSWLGLLAGGIGGWFLARQTYPKRRA